MQSTNTSPTWIDLGIQNTRGRVDFLIEILLWNVHAVFFKTWFCSYHNRANWIFFGTNMMAKVCVGHLASFSCARMKSNAFATIKLNFSRVGKEVGKHQEAWSSSPRSQPTMVLTMVLSFALFLKFWLFANIKISIWMNKLFRSLFRRKPFNLCQLAKDPHENDQVSSRKWS